MFDIGPNNTVLLKEAQILMIKEFHKLWVKDKSKDKLQVNKEFAYIYFKNDFKSPYRNAYTEEELPVRLKIDLMLDKEWKSTPLIVAAEEKYNELQTTKSLKMLLAAEQALEQITTYFNDFKIDKITEDKKAEAISKLMSNLKSVDDVVGRLEAAKDKVAKELQTQKLSGSKKLAPRELPRDKRGTY